MAKHKGTKNEKELLFEDSTDNSEVIEKGIEEQIESSMIDYGSYIVENRAIPSMLDGFKISQRRTIYTFKHLNVIGKSVKLARISGTTIAEFHPHGDTAIEDTSAIMSQKWKNNFTFFKTQGNWGSIGGDRPAAARYVEIELEKNSEEFLFEHINKGNAVPWHLNYDDRLQEPMLLPVKYPFHLVNGTSGIAYAMATNIPSYNIIELTKLFIYMIDNKYWKDTWNLEEHRTNLLDIFGGPDMPTYCDVCFKNNEEFEKSLFDHKFSFTMKANFHLDHKNNVITVSNIPFNVSTSKIKEELLLLMQDMKMSKDKKGKKQIIKKQDNEILNLQASVPIDITINESDYAKVQIVLKFKSSADLNVELVKILQGTSLQKVFSAEITTINQNGIPEDHSLYKNIRTFLYFRRHVIFQKFLYEIEQLQKQLYLLNGLAIVLNEKEQFLKILTTEEEYKTKILEYFTELKEDQLNYILELKIQKLTKLAVEKIYEEIKNIECDILEKQEKISTSDNIFKIIKKEYQDLLETKKISSSIRKSEIFKNYSKTTLEDTIKNENIILMLMNDDTIGYIEKTKFQAKNRGTQLKDSKLANEGFDINVKSIYDGMLKDECLFITDKGRVFYEKLWKFSKKLLNVRNYFKLLPDENVIKIINKNDKKNNTILFTTKNLIKNISLNMFKKVTSNSGKIGLKIKDDDLITNVILHNNKVEQFVIVLSEDGKIIKFDKEDIKVSLGNTAAGTRVINKNYVVKDVFLVDKLKENDTYVMIVSNNGKGKKVDISSIGLKKIKQSPINVFENNENNGTLLKGILLDKNEEQEIVLVDILGRVNVIKIDEELRSVSRSAKGSIKLINNNDNAKIVFASKNEILKEEIDIEINEDEDEDEDDEEIENEEVIENSELEERE